MGNFIKWRPFDNEPQCKEKQAEDQNDKKQRTKPLKVSQVIVNDFMPSNITGSVAKVGLKMHDCVPYGNEPPSRSNRCETAKYRNQAILDPKHDAKKTSKKFISYSLVNGGETACWEAF